MTPNEMLSCLRVCGGGGVHKLQRLRASSRGETEACVRADHDQTIATFPHLPARTSEHGVLEAVRDVADQLQRAAREPPRRRGQGASVRPGADLAGRGAAVPAPEQPPTSHHQLEGNQSQASDVTGRATSFSAVF